MTTKIDNSIEEEWLQWQRNVFIPDVMSTGLFNDHRIFKLLEQDEADGKTYILQFYADNKNLCGQYIVEHSERIRNKSINKWGDGFISFQSLLESVQ